MGQLTQGRVPYLRPIHFRGVNVGGEQLGEEKKRKFDYSLILLCERGKLRGSFLLSGENGCGIELKLFNEALRV